MDQYTLGLDPLPKKTRKEVFLEEMNQVVPWAMLVALITPLARGAHQALGGRPPFPIETMLRIHCLQLWWNLSDPAFMVGAQANSGNAGMSPWVEAGRRRLKQGHVPRWTNTGRVGGLTAFRIRKCWNSLMESMGLKCLMLQSQFLMLPSCMPPLLACRCSN